MVSRADWKKGGEDFEGEGVRADFHVPTVGDSPLFQNFQDDGKRSLERKWTLFIAVCPCLLPYLGHTKGLCSISLPKVSLSVA